MSDPIFQTSFKIDLDLLRSQMGQVLTSVDFHQNQICMTYSDTCEDKLHSCTGSPYQKNHQQKDEHLFVHFNKCFKNTIFEEIYLFLQEETNGKVGRFRLMKMPPRSSITWHRDREMDKLRYHLAIETHPGAFLLFSDEIFDYQNIRGFHVPADGHLYCMDAQWPHTAINTSARERIHLVANVFR